MNCSNYNKISKLKILFFIPRRGKGHTEVSCNISVSSSSSIEPENFISHFVKYQKKSLSKDIIKEIGDDIYNALPLKDLYINLDFSLPINRVSPSLEESLCFYLDSSYQLQYKEENVSLAMNISCPIRVDYISTMQGKLKLSAIDVIPNLYFEDLLDVVQQYGDVVIYPLNNFEDKEVLTKKIDKGKSLDEYISYIQTGATRRGLAKKWGLILNVYDVYNNYEIEKGILWEV